VNRPELLSQMEQVLGHAPRTGRSMATLFIDLDGLKSINDTSGHSAGYAVIVGVAERLRSNVRRGDLVARLGGDEFVVVLPAIHSVDDAERIAQKIQDAMIDPIAAESGARADDVLEFADRALYRAKRSGRAKTVTFDPRMDAASQDRD
jgi:diguanylate cyclase (GGDEF)-like protein